MEGVKRGRGEATRLAQRLPPPLVQVDQDVDRTVQFVGPGDRVQHGPAGVQQVALQAGGSVCDGSSRAWPDRRPTTRAIRSASSSGLRRRWTVLPASSSRSMSWPTSGVLPVDAGQFQQVPSGPVAIVAAGSTRQVVGHRPGDSVARCPAGRASPNSRSRPRRSRAGARRCRRSRTSRSTTGATATSFSARSNTQGTNSRLEPPGVVGRFAVVFPPGRQPGPTRASAHRRPAGPSRRRTGPVR